MGSIIGSCCGAMFAGMCCGACAQCKPAKTGPTSRLPYLFLLILSGIFATFMSVYGEKNWDLELTSVTCAGCSGNGSVFRVALCLFIFELIHVVFIGLGAVSFHWIWFALKFMVYICAVIVTFFFGSNKFYSNFGQFSRYGPSPIYLVLQILILINCGYVLNETLQRKGNQESGGKKYFCMLIFGSIFMYVGSVVLLILMYVYYGGSTCNTHNAIITISFVLVLLNCGLSMWIGKGNFFVSSIVSLYITYLSLAGLQSSTSCNSLDTEKDSILWLWIGVSIALATLVYAGLRSNLLAEFFQQPDDYTAIEEPLLTKEEKEKAIDIETQDDKDKDKEDGEDDGTSNYDENNKKINKSNYDDDDLKSNKGDDEMNDSQTLTVKKEAVSFHIIMTLASAYMAMLLTNWGTAHGSISTSGTASMWVNIVCSWVTAILFYWTLLAPKLCPNRFDEEHNEDDD